MLLFFVDLRFVHCCFIGTTEVLKNIDECNSSAEDDNELYIALYLQQ